MKIHSSKGCLKASILRKITSSDFLHEDEFSYYFLKALFSLDLPFEA